MAFTKGVARIHDFIIRGGKMNRAICFFVRERKGRGCRWTTPGLLGFLILLLLCGAGAASAEKIPWETRQKLMAASVPWIVNQGQYEDRVRYVAGTFSGTVYVTDDGKTVYQLPMRVDKSNRGWVLVEEALGSLPIREIRGEKESEARVSFFIGNDPSKWQKGLSTYETVSLGEIYPGIVLKIQAHGGSVEKFYQVAPGGDPRTIRVRVHGADSLNVNSRGELEVETGNGTVLFSKPIAFQKGEKEQEIVEVAYNVDGDSYGFMVGDYDTGRELVIDPLIQSTYLGGTSLEYAYSVAYAEGYVYLAGYSYSTNFPGTSGGYQQTFVGEGTTDVVVSKLSADLKQVVQSTYIGGSSYEQAYSLAVSGGYVYVAGTTYSSDFPGTNNGAQPAFGGGIYDAFVSKLSTSLTQLVQSTYVGGSSYDQAYSLAVSGDYVWVAGETWSTDFPFTAGGAQSAFGGWDYDAFVTKLDAGLTQFVQSTFLGGNDNEAAWSMAVSGDYVWVAGWTGSDDFPGRAGGAQAAKGGNEDAFVAKLNLDLKQISQSTYLGGSGNDAARSLAISGDYAYVAGVTGSADFPGRAGGGQAAKGAGEDAFVAKLNADLKQIAQSTYLGGGGNDGARSLAVAANYVYVTGETSSADFPGTTGGAQPMLGGGGNDIFVSLLSADLKPAVLKKDTSGYFDIPTKKGGGSVIYLE